MKNTNVILYSPGAYGHFINWCCDYFSGNLDSHEIPLNDLGNCHQYSNVKLLTRPPMFKNYTESIEEYPFVQIHEGSFDPTDDANIEKNGYYEILKKNLTYLQTNYKKSIYVYPTETSKIWITNNSIYKIRISDWIGAADINIAREYFRSLGIEESQIDVLVSYGDEKIKKIIDNCSNLKENLSHWGHTNINDFDLWELREFLSSYFYDRLSAGIIPADKINGLKLRYTNIYFIELDSLRNNFNQTISDILTHFEIDNVTNWNNIDNIQQTWTSKQLHINKDAQLSEIVTALINNKSLDWSSWNLTTVDEFTIQRLLRNNQIDIKCYNLNKFPTNTQDFAPLLERV